MRMSAVWGKCVGDGCAELATTWREVVELGEAIAKFDVAEIVEEWHDVVAGIQGGFHIPVYKTSCCITDFTHFSYPFHFLLQLMEFLMVTVPSV